MDKKKKRKVNVLQVQKSESMDQQQAGRETAPQAQIVKKLSDLGFWCGRHVHCCVSSKNLVEYDTRVFTVVRTEQNQRAQLL
jgi:hypothetical protein